MFNLINKYYNKKELIKLYILQNTKECKKNHYLLTFGGTLYCVPNHSNKIDTFPIPNNKKTISRNKSLNYDEPIYK
tara:strand:- start:1902 stop:2129 length:228 start_codon:yes stop_codon:yes gene_type:complete